MQNIRYCSYYTSCIGEYQTEKAGIVTNIKKMYCKSNKKKRASLKTPSKSQTFKYLPVIKHLKPHTEAT